MEQAYTSSMDPSQGRGRSKEERAEIARAAVRALAEGRAADLSDAIERGIAEAGAGPRARRPTRAELRAHAQAHEESTVGTEGRSRRIAAALEEALGVLAILEETVVSRDPQGCQRRPPAVYGRAARGELDLDPVVHVRVETSLAAATLAQALFDHGCADPTCGSLETRYGRLDEIRFDGGEAAFRVVRIPPRMAVDRDRDLVRGVTVEHADYETLAARARRA
jgi:hypothetical protein